MFNLVVSCKLNNDSFKSIEIGDFICATNITTFDGENDDVAIIGLSEEGKQKEVLIFPNMLDGHKVVKIGAQYVLKSSGPIESEMAKKVYFCNNSYAKYTNFKKVDLYFKNAERYVALTSSSEGNLWTFAISTINNYVENKIKEYANLTPESNYCIKTSNLNYYVDNDCYFVDYIENDKVSVIPPAPYKEGYTFDGWFKDIEYKEKWDFDKDIVPLYDIEYDDEGNEIYKDTILYAKWI